MEGNLLSLCGIGKRGRSKLALCYNDRVKFSLIQVSALGLGAVLVASACSSEDDEPGAGTTPVGMGSSSSSAAGSGDGTGATTGGSTGTGSNTGGSTGSSTGAQNTGAGAGTNTGATSNPSTDGTNAQGAGGTGEPGNGSPTDDDSPTDDGSEADDAASGAGGVSGDDPAGAGGGVGEGGAGGMSGDEPAGGTGGTAGGSGGEMGNDDPQPGSGFRCPADPGTPDFSAQVNEVGGVPLADGFGQGFSILEGPVWTGESLLFTQIATDAQPNPSRIYELAGGAASIFLDDAGGNGLALDGDGNLLVARHSDGALVRITLPDLNDTVIVSDYEGAVFNSPNDIAYRSDGNIYFSDPSYQRPSDRPEIPTRIYRVDPMGNVSVVDGEKQAPNGVALSLDENWLFASGQMPLTRYPVMEDGSTGPGETMGNTGQMLQGGDGLGRDCLGNLYVTANSNVTVVDTNSDEFAIVDTFTFPNTVTNVAFGGADRSTMYVTTLGSEPRLYSVQLGVVGMPY